MRHRRRGRKLGRSTSHRKAMLRNMASSLFLTERDTELDDNEPKVRGRIITTVQKAKEVRPLVERCITIARRSLEHERNAEEFETAAERNTEEWKQWRSGEEWRKWNQAIAPAVAARRRALRLLGDKEAVRILFSDIAPRFETRNGGYTRIVRLATPRLGDNGTRAILEFVGVRDREVERSERPEFEDEQEKQDVPKQDVPKQDVPKQVPAESSAADPQPSETRGETDEPRSASAEDQRDEQAPQEEETEERQDEDKK